MDLTDNVAVSAYAPTVADTARQAARVVATSRIRLLEFLTVFGFGGTERQVVNLARMLNRTRFEPHFACMKRWGHFLEDIERMEIPISEYRINSLYKPATWRQQMLFASYLKRHAIEIAHSYNFYANVFAAPAARLAGVPVVIASIRDTGMGHITPARLRVHRLACRFADCVLVNAAAVRDWLVGQGYDASKIRIIRNGIDLSRFAQVRRTEALRHELGLPEKAPLVVVLARLVPHKGIESFLEAAAIVKTRCPDARFLIVGDVFAASSRDGTFQQDVAYRDSLRRQADRLGLGANLIFTGYRSDIPQLLAHAAVSVLPSVGGEGLPNALLESMAAGVPVIATRVGGSAEVIERDGVDGLLVAPRDPAGMAEAICAVLTDEDLARRLGHDAQRRVTQNFSLERMVQETENLYERLLDRARRSKTRRKEG